MRRSVALAVAGGLFVLLAADVVYWRIASQRLTDGVLTWIDAQRARGWNVESGPIETGGWPRAATAFLPGLMMQHRGAEMPGDLKWTSGGVSLSLPLFRPTSIEVALHGVQHLQIADQPELAIAGDRITADVPMSDDPQLSIDVHASGLRIGPAGGDWHADVALLDGHADIPEATPAGAAAGSDSFDISADAIVLPAQFRWPLGAEIRSISMAGLLNGPLPQPGFITAWASAWRDGGGSLEVKHMAVEWGPMSIVSSATLALDDQLQPMGSGTAKVAGYAETLDRLSAGGVLTKSAAQVAKAVLSLLAGSTGSEDGPSSVDVPLTLQYRTLSMRQVPLVRLPELDWPAR